MSEEKNLLKLQFDLEAFAKKVAADTATEIAMKQAEAKAAEQKAADRSCSKSY